VSSKHLIPVQNDLDGGEIGVERLRNFSGQQSLELSTLSATAISSVRKENLVISRPTFQNASLPIKVELKKKSDT
jgi:hypothetical protein